MDEEREALEQCTEELVSPETTEHPSADCSSSRGLPFFQVLDNVFHSDFTT
jgi:hypothetical protein